MKTIITEIKMRNFDRNRFTALVPATYLLFASVLAVALTALKGDKTKSGHDDIPQFGGPGSVGANLIEDNEIRKFLYRIEGKENALKRWFDWKGDLNKKYGFIIELVGTAGIIAH